MAKAKVYAIHDGEDDLLDAIAELDDDKDCYNCAHFDGGHSCAAFPEEDGGIPIEILSGPVVHDKAIEGDHGIQWKLKRKSP